MKYIVTECLTKAFSRGNKKENPNWTNLGKTELFCDYYNQTELLEV